MPVVVGEALRSSRLQMLLLLSFIISGRGQGTGIAELVALPDMHRQSLLNGMEILFLPTNQSRVPFVLMIRNGAAFDPINKWGVTFLMTTMMLQETREQGSSGVRNRLQQLGAKLNLRVEWDALFLSGSVAVEHLAETLNILAQMVVRPKFKEKHFQILRARLVEQVNRESQAIDAFTRQLFLFELFKGNPYMHSVKGTADTLQNLHLSDVKIQHRKLVIPNETQLAMYYSGDRQELFRTLSRRWGGWVKKIPVPFTFQSAERPSKPRIVLVDHHSQRGLFRWGTISVSEGDQDYYPLKIFEQYITLCFPDWAREVAADNYIRAVAQVRASKMPDRIEVSIQAPSHQLVPYFRRFLRTVEELRHGRIDLSKFKEAKQLIVLEFKESFQDPVSQLGQLLRANLYSLGMSYISNYGLRLARVSPQVFQSLLEKYLTSQAFLMVIAGPAGELKPELEQLGRVETRTGLCPFLN